jgi:DNA-3-methyladenine glycosylase II
VQAVAADVRLTGPLDLPRSLEGFRRYGDDLIDRWDGHYLVRTVPVAGGHVAYAAIPEGTIEEPMLRVVAEDETYLADMVRALEETFLTPPSRWPDLLRQDPVLARLDAHFPGIRPVRQIDLLGALVRSISAQQVNLVWAATTRRRLAERFGVRHTVADREVYAFDAARLVSASISEIRDLQFTTRKAEYIVGVARAIAAGELTLTDLDHLPDEEVVARLTTLRGIGRWTAEWLLVRTMGRPVVVAGDLGVRKAVGAAYLGRELAREDEVRAATAHWGECAAVAQNLLLQGLVEGLLPSPAQAPDSPV